MAKQSSLLHCLAFDYRPCRATRDQAESTFFD
ncbi:uncharacterized protein VDAG_03916 [Verticillium dahliae VdLs.17]|uniref:Uncharacterized protein n=1 Tax=Verticillium dahliae (strain VdLs.17 / ATCC MYA-4575 / FGSC 10137) TaxID=498257 RepID=G2X0Y7_VERDV|nr:uncharacterized protein VDAG_03916 [Verticillium dahliae VdLs.17]EGY22478.1 hypothetical protein VDAG_03916 [Verticillium dahliae VdLs.17]